jgi:ferrous iron transport protein A
MRTILVPDDPGERLVMRWQPPWTSAASPLLAPAPAPAAAGRPPGAPLALDRTGTGQRCRVVAVHAPAAQPDWGRWLQEIGFLPGEPVTVLRRSLWGGDPLVVRVGDSAFALRRAEAACVQVEPLA